MALDLQGSRFVVVHTVPEANAKLTDARFTVVHTIPLADATLMSARLVVVHTLQSEGQETLQGESLVGLDLQGAFVSSPNRFRE